MRGKVGNCLQSSPKSYGCNNIANSQLSVVSKVTATRGEVARSVLVYTYDSTADNALPGYVHFAHSGFVIVPKLSDYFEFGMP